MGDTGVRNSWGWGLPSYRQQYETEDEPSSRHEAPVYVAQSPSLSGRVPQSPMMGRRHSMSAVRMPETPKQRPLQSPTFISKVLKVQDRLSVSFNSAT